MARKKLKTPGLFWRSDSRFVQCTYKSGAKWVNESTKETDETKARDYLELRRADAVRGIPIHRYKKTTFKDLEKSVLRHYTENGRRTLAKTKRNLEVLSEFFGDRRIIDIGANEIAEYRQKRLTDKLVNASVNRELATLRLGLRLLAEEDRIPKAPKVKLLPENNARQRFFSIQEIESFKQALQQHAPWLYPPFMLSLHTGWRKETVLSLEWKHVDRANGIIRVPGQLTKSGQPVQYPYREDAVIRRIIEREHQIRDSLLPWVFLNKARTSRIRDFRGSWNKCIEKAEIGDGLGYGAGYKAGTKWHDIKRSFIVLNEMAGNPRTVSMDISGTKSSTIYERYAVVDNARRVDAIRKRQRFLESIAAQDTSLSKRPPDKQEVKTVPNLSKEPLRQEEINVIE